MSYLKIWFFTIQAKLTKTSLIEGGLKNQDAFIFSQFILFPVSGKAEQTKHKATLRDLRKSLKSENSSNNSKLTLEIFLQFGIKTKSSKNLFD